MIVPFLWTYPLQRFVIYRNKSEETVTDEPVETVEE